MRHYEVVILVHPDQTSEVPEMIKRHEALITEGEGKVHRVEDWGRKVLAYPVDRAHKAHYVLTNIECDQATLNKLENSFKFNDAIIRNLILLKDAAESEQSIMAINDASEGHKYTSRVVDYKNIPLLKTYIMESGKLVPARISGISSKRQRNVSKAVKLARFLSLLHYCDNHR